MFYFGLLCLYSIVSFCKSAAAAAAKSLQSYLTLCDPIDGSPSGSTVPEILQARTLEWVAISFSNAWKWKVKVKSLSRVRLLATPWTAAYQAPPSLGFFQARVLVWGAIAFSVYSPAAAAAKSLQSCLTLTRLTYSPHYQEIKELFLMFLNTLNE